MRRRRLVPPAAAQWEEEECERNVHQTVGVERGISATAGLEESKRPWAFHMQHANTVEPRLQPSNQTCPHMHSSTCSSPPPPAPPSGTPSPALSPSSKSTHPYMHLRTSLLSALRRVARRRRQGLVVNWHRLRGVAVALGIVHGIRTPQSFCRLESTKRKQVCKAAAWASCTAACGPQPLHMPACRPAVRQPRHAAAHLPYTEGDSSPLDHCNPKQLSTSDLLVTAGLVV